MITKKIAIVLILIVWIMVNGIYAGLIRFDVIGNAKAGYTQHSPIRINNNTEFSSIAGLEGWAGDGSPGNPYIIEGYDINGSGFSYCIYIGNTIDFFMVRDCFLHEASGVDNPPYFFQTGLILYNVQNGIISNNTVSSNNKYGIYLYFSNSNIIVNNTVSNNDRGILLSSSNNNTITNNTASSNNQYCVHLVSSSSNNIITNNTASNSQYGIYLDSACNSNIIANNTALNNSDSGIYLHSSSSNTIANNTAISNTVYGIYLETSSSNNIIVNNTATNNVIGIRLDSSSSNTITNNTVSSNNINGIRLYSFSNNNIVVNNTVSDNDRGIYLYWSVSSNTIAYNIASNNNFGIYLFSSSSSNIIYHNNFIDNANQSYDDTNNGNQWDNGYPIGGNYWSDYSGVDNFKGPYQNIPGSDGIGDNPYLIDADSQDNYPLMEPFTRRIYENYTVLKQGWNLISIPLIQSNEDLKTVLQMIEGYYDAVQWYNLTNINDHWKHYKVEKPFGNDLFELNEYIGFWIHITNPGDTIFIYNGTQLTVNQTISLIPGWNLVGYPSKSNKNRTDALNNIDFGSDVDAIWTYYATTQTWKEITASDNFEVGRGYWMHSKVTKTWIVPL